jgi:pimeloyl-ACP methyl ester carboxylesterase
VKDKIYRQVNSREELIQFMDGALSGWPYPYETRMVDTRVGQTHVFTAGDKSKPALLLLHGSQSNLLSWGGDIPQYLGEYDIIAPDIPGEAGKSAPVRLSWKNDDAINWLADLLDAQGIAEVSIVGMSLGGFYAMRFAAAVPQRVKKLALIAPGGIVPISKKILFDALKNSRAMQDPEKAKKVLFGDAEAHPAVVQYFLLMQKHMRPRLERLPLLSEGELKRISAPMLFILGENDRLFDAKKMQRRIAEANINAEVSLILQGGHGIMQQTECIARFLKEGG